MLKLIPAVKQAEIFEGFLGSRAICYGKGIYDGRIERALSEFDYDVNGTPVEIYLGEGEKEEYSLSVHESGIKIVAGDKFRHL